MGLKFLNKKGWHTGSLRNIENVWKAEQKHNAEQSKLEELRKQIHEEREKAEFRQLQEQAGLVPRQERLDFLYESGLGVGKTSEGFKALEAPAPAITASANAEASSSKAGAPGALFEEKPQSANDTWRKLHSDPLLLIRQREQEALARIKNNPVKMSMIRKSVEAEKKRNKEDKEERSKKKHHHGRSKSKNPIEKDKEKRKRNNVRRKDTWKSSSEDEEERSHHRRRNEDEGERSHHRRRNEDEEERKHRSKDYEKDEMRKRESRNHHEQQQSYSREGGHNGHRKRVQKMTEEERDAKLKEMQRDAELHEEQRWRRIKHAAEADAQEVATAGAFKGKNFLDDAQKSIYGAEKGGSSTIEESVRRRAYYSQGGTAAHETNPFRR